uniref:Uncharacterized protein n=1 Tax=Trichobilharzia regenti TaxID=157069 RepID=A0AA85KGG6_TRIRE|nr:unnamed protein product [Trichobilharzia regenti]
MKLLHILAVISLLLFIHSNDGQSTKRRWNAETCRRRTKSVGEEILKDQAIFRGFNDIIRKNRINLKKTEEDLKLLSASAEDKMKSMEDELENLKKKSEAGRLVERMKQAEIDYIIAVANYEEIEDEITALHQDIAKANATQLEKTREFNSLLDTIKSEIEIQEHVLDEFQQQLNYVIRIINNWFIEEQLREATIQYKYAHVDYDGKKASYEELQRILDKQYGEEYNAITDFDIQRDELKLAKLQESLEVKKKEMKALRDHWRSEQISIENYINETRARREELRTNFTVEKKAMIDKKRRIGEIEKQLTNKTIKKAKKDNLKKLRTKLNSEVDSIRGLLSNVKTEHHKSEETILEAKDAQRAINDNRKSAIGNKQVEINEIKNMISITEKNLQDWSNYRRLKNSADAAKESLLAAESVVSEKSKAVTDLEAIFDPELLYSNRTKVMILHKDLLGRVQYRKDEIEFLKIRYNLIQNQEEIELQAIQTELETLKLEFNESHVAEEKLKAEMDEKNNLMHQAEWEIHPSEVDEETDKLRNTSKILQVKFTKIKEKFLSVTDKMRKKRLTSLIHRTNIRNVLPYLRGANNTIFELREELKILRERCVEEGGEGVSGELTGQPEDNEHTIGVEEGGEGVSGELTGQPEDNEHTIGECRLPFCSSSVALCQLVCSRSS